MNFKKFTNSNQRMSMFPLPVAEKQKNSDIYNKKYLKKFAFKKD